MNYAKLSDNNIILDSGDILYWNNMVYGTVTVPDTLLYSTVFSGVNYWETDEERALRVAEENERWS
jgi:hypothetical protein